MANKYVKTQTPRSELHDKILIETKKMFHKQGIKQVRMDDIAKYLSISKRTLYEIFQDKETLLLECIKKKHQLQEKYVFGDNFDFSNANVLDVVLRYYKHTIEELPYINPAFFEDLKKYPNVVAYMRSERDKDFKKVVNYFNRGIEEGIFRKDVNMELFIRLLNLTFDNCMETDIYKQYPMQEIYRAIIFTHLRGIATEKGLEILNAFIHPPKL